jgi:hypothetical protein
MRRTFTADFLRRLLAAGSAALVLALSVFAASPVAHDSLHDHGVQRGDDTCAVVLFASGVALPLDVPAVVPPSSEWQPAIPAVAAEILLTSPRYLHHPERGPPSNLIG